MIYLQISIFQYISIFHRAITGKMQQKSFNKYIQTILLTSRQDVFTPISDFLIYIRSPSSLILHLRHHLAILSHNQKAL